MQKRLTHILIGAALSGSAVAGCSSAPDGSNDTINVLMVDNPQMSDLKILANDFTRTTGIKVNFTVLPENQVGDVASKEFSTQAGKYDVTSISNFEVPYYAERGWLEPLGRYIEQDAQFDQEDILRPIAASPTARDGLVYAEPFYGESSFLMYRQDILAEAGIRMRPTPTWQEVADIAERVDGARPGMRGICLRGLPGWGEMIAPLTTVVNTFGGTWFTKDWQASVDSAEFTEATKFYVDLIKKHGELDPERAGYSECLDSVLKGKVAMWYDSTAAAGQLEAEGSQVRSLMGYVPAPVMQPKASGWLYTWAWGIEKAGTRKDLAWKFVSWSSSKHYEDLVGATLGWEKVPAGKRESTYSNPQYLSSAGSFAQQTELAILSAEPKNPGMQPRPTIGIQFVDIPEFVDLGNKVSQDLSKVLTGDMKVGEVLAAGQELAQSVAVKYRK
ncbi:ABC transporter substrate-binding protein [Amycolatopsis sp. lyj-23]|uniref:ABC transporter substrate-binding protein n=1 Tax=Amycolatopsis sp. lyj-23 TaxID=2789283 RepID=UPI00397A2AFF